MGEGLEQGRRGFLKRAGLAAMGAGILGTGSAEARTHDPKTISPDTLLPPKSRFTDISEPQTDLHEDRTVDPFEIPEGQLEFRKMSDLLEVDSRIFDMLNEDPEHFFLDPATGSLHVSSFRDGKPGAPAAYDSTIDPQEIRSIRVTGLPEANGVLITAVFKGDVRERVIVRRNFFGDHIIEGDSPARLLDEPGEVKRG